MRTITIKNVRITKESYRSGGETKTRWYVRLGKKFTGTKAKKKRFTDYADAKKWIVAEQTRRDEQGSTAFTLTPLQQAQAAAAIKRLAEAAAKVTLEEVVTYYLKRERPAGGIKTLAEAITDFGSAKKREGVSEHYLDRVLDTVRQFAKAFPLDVTCNAITEQECADWLFQTKSNLTANGRRHYHADLYSFFAWVEKKGFIGENPWGKVEKPAKQPTKTEVLTVAQAHLLLCAAAGTPLIVPIALALYCGIRTGELARLSWSDIHLTCEEPRVELHAATTKKKRRRVIELKPAAIAWLATAPTKEGMVMDGIGERVRELHRRLRRDNPGYRYPHNAARHSFASYAYAAHGLDWTLRALGHAGSAAQFLEHYHALVTKSDAAAYWALRPSTTGNVIPMTPPTPPTPPPAAEDGEKQAAG